MSASDIFEPQVCVEYGNRTREHSLDTNPVTGCGQWSNENWCHTLSTPPHKTVNNDVIVSHDYEGDDDDKDVEDNALMVPDIHFVLLHALEGDGKCNGSKNNCFKLSDYLIFFPLNCR